MNTWITLYGWFWPALMFALLTGMLTVGGYITYLIWCDTRRTGRKTNTLT